MESRGCCNSPAAPAVMLHEIVCNSSVEALKLPFSSSDDPDMLKTFIQNTQMWISDEFEGKHVVSQTIYFHVICIILSLDCNFFQVCHSLCVGNQELWFTSCCVQGISQGKLVFGTGLFWGRLLKLHFVAEIFCFNPRAARFWVLGAAWQ